AVCVAPRAPCQEGPRLSVRNVRRPGRLSTCGRRRDPHLPRRPHAAADPAVDAKLFRRAAREAEVGGAVARITSGFRLSAFGFRAGRRAQKAVVPEVRNPEKPSLKSPGPANKSITGTARCVAIQASVTWTPRRCTCPIGGKAKGLIRRAEPKAESQKPRAAYCGIVSNATIES